MTKSELILKWVDCKPKDEIVIQVKIGNSVMEFVLEDVKYDKKREVLILEANEIDLEILE